MIVKEVANLLTASQQPVVKPLEINGAQRIIALGLKKGVELKKHKAPAPSKLLVISGVVEYVSAISSTTLHAYEEIKIPLEEFHSVIGKEDAVCLLMIGTTS